MDWVSYDGLCVFLFNISFVYYFYVFFLVLCIVVLGVYNIIVIVRVGKDLIFFLVFGFFIIVSVIREIYV